MNGKFTIIILEKEEEINYPISSKSQCEFRIFSDGSADVQSWERVTNLETGERNGRSHYRIERHIKDAPQAVRVLADLVVVGWKIISRESVPGVGYD